MTDLNLELNVLHYSKKELEDLFNLKENYKFKFQSSYEILKLC